MIRRCHTHEAEIEVGCFVNPNKIRWIPLFSLLMAWIRGENRSRVGRVRNDWKIRRKELLPTKTKKLLHILCPSVIYFHILSRPQKLNWEDTTTEVLTFKTNRVLCFSSTIRRLVTTDTAVTGGYTTTVQSAMLFCPISSQKWFHVFSRGISMKGMQMGSAGSWTRFANSSFRAGVHYASSLFRNVWNRLVSTWS